MRNWGLLFLPLWYAFPISNHFFSNMHREKYLNSQNVYCISSCVRLMKKGNNMKRDASFEVSGASKKQPKTRRCSMKIFNTWRAHFNKVEEECMTTLFKNWNSTTDSSSCNTGQHKDTYTDAIPTLVPTIGDTALSVGLQGRCYHHRVPRLTNMTCWRESQDNEFSFFIPAIVANAVGNWPTPLFSVLPVPRESLTNPPSTQVSGESKTLQAEDKQIDIIRILNMVSGTRAEIVKV